MRDKNEKMSTTTSSVKKYLIAGAIVASTALLSSKDADAIETKNSEMPYTAAISAIHNINSSRNSFYPISLAEIGKESELEKTKIFEMQEKLGSVINEEAGTESIHRLDILIDLAKKTIPIDTVKIEYYGDIAFKVRKFKEAIDAYEFAGTWGSATAPDKLHIVAQYIFSKPGHVCGNRHNQDGWCHLRGKTIRALKSIGSKEHLLDIGQLTSSKEMYHCAVHSYTAAVEKGSLEARKKLIDLGKKLKKEDPYLANVAEKCAWIRDNRILH